MNRATENKIILVKRRTRLDDLIARFNTLGQARFYIEHLGADFSDYVEEHQHYYQMVKQTEDSLSGLGRLQVLDRSFLPNFIFGEKDTVVVLGQDGLVANTVKYLKTQTVIGVNPDQSRWDGVLVRFSIKDLAWVVPSVFAGTCPIKEVTMAKVRLNTGQTLYAVNDFFIGVKSHASARYLIQFGPKQEQHSSSGIIVSTGLGSTGWFKSLMTGAITIASQVTGQRLQLETSEHFTWDAEYLYYTVREPFPSKASSASLVFGKITRTEPLQLISQMAESGVIFSDGIENDFLEFNSGTHATVTLAEKKGHIAV